MNDYRFENLIEERMKEASVPGLAVAIIRNEEITYAKGFGVTSTEDGGIPITPQTIFRIGSISKSLTGTAIMRLVEEGLLELDKPIKHYIPWFEVSDVSASSKITVRMLLSHTSGLPTGPTDKNGKRDYGGLEELVRDLPNHPLMFSPGKTWCYSDKGIDVLGYIIEVVTGKGFGQAMRELVFKPLRMARTTFDPLIAMTYPFALPHVKANDKITVLHEPIENTGEHASGFGMSTVTDMARFVMVHMNEGKIDNSQFLSSESVHTMHTLHGNYYMPNDNGYGLTFEVETYKGIRRVWHDGAISSFCSWMYMAPENGLAVILLANWRDGFWSHAVSLINTIFDELLELQDEKEPVTIETDRSLWSKFAGHYVGPWMGYLSIAEEGHHLTIELNGEKTQLKAYREDLYIGKDKNDELISVGFLLNDNEPVLDLMVNGIPCERVAETPESVKTDLSTYIGSYISMNDELTFRIENDSLYCYDKYDNVEFVCKRANDNLFTFGSNLIEFIIKETGEAYALRLNKSRLFPRHFATK